MRKLDPQHQILQILAGAAFLRFPLSQLGYELDRGLILVADEDFQANALANELIRALGAVDIPKFGKNMKRPFNHVMGLHRYKKKDKDEDLEEFLTEKEFLPVIIVGGIVPEFLRGCYTFRFSLQPEMISSFTSINSIFKKYILEKKDYIFQEIRLLKTSELAQKYQQNQQTFLGKYLLAIGRAWWCILREDNGESAVDKWLDDFMESAAKFENDMERLNEIYSVKEAVRMCITDYVIKKKIPVREARGGNVPETAEESILFDDTYYFIAEELIKKMCTPLLETVSVVQLKREMAAEGMLVTDKVSGNYTVKIQLYNAKTGGTQRLRFLKLLKTDLLTEEGLPLENLQLILK